MHDEFGLAGIFHSVRDGLIMVRFPGRDVVLFNEAASEISGIPVEQAPGMTLDGIFEDPAVRETARRCSEQPVGVWPGDHQEVLQTRFKGHGLEEDGVELRFCRVEDVGRGGPLVLLVMRPSSEAKLVPSLLEGDIMKSLLRGDRAERRVEVMEEEARAHALFFSEAAHEFNTPLTVVALQVQLLRGTLGTVTPAQVRALDIIKANVHRLVLLSKDVVDLARADAGRLVLKSLRLDLQTIVKEEVENFKALANQENLTIQFAASGAPAKVTGEPARLRQVLDNFLGNAVKFTPPGGQIDVEVVTTAEASMVRVKDTGPGMKAEDLERLFLPFVRITSPGAPKKPGTGLGLYLSKRIVEAHGGQVGCSSDGPGKGMTFWFKVPAT